MGICFISEADLLLLNRQTCRARFQVNKGPANPDSISGAVLVDSNVACTRHRATVAKFLTVDTLFARQDAEGPPNPVSPLL